MKKNITPSRHNNRPANKTATPFSGKPLPSHPRKNETSGQKRQSSYTASLLYGFHAIREAWLNPERECVRLMMTSNAAESFADVLAEAKQRGIKPRPTPEIVDRSKLDALLPDAVHQGIVLDTRPLPELAIEDIIRAASLQDKACVMILDQVTDPHNVGAILRSCAAFGALALLIPERNAPPLGGVLCKTASGAADITPVVQIKNLSRAIDQLRDAGFWTVGFAESGEKTLANTDLGGKIALIMGAEGDGLRRLTIEHCDLVARLPTLPPIGSLNVSNAAAIALYEVFRTSER